MMAAPIDQPALGISPRRNTLLKIIRESAHTLRGSTDDPQLLAHVQIIDTCANELLLRSDHDAMSLHYQAGLRLVEEGRRLLARTDAWSAYSAEIVANSEIDDAIMHVSAELEQQVGELAERDWGGTVGFRKSAVAWELDLYAYRLQDRGAPGCPRCLFNQSELEDYLRKRWPDLADLRVTQFRRIQGGFSKYTLLFSTHDMLHGAREFVARIEPPVKFMDLDGMDVANEFPVVKLAFEGGLPVAEPLWLEDDIEKLGWRFFVSRRAPGEVYGTMKGAGRAIPDRTLEMIADMMARLHTLQLPRDNPWIAASHLAGWLDYPSLSANSIGVLDYWLQKMADDGVRGSIVLADAVEWLRRNVPSEDAPFSLIHGDIGLHNLMIEDGELTAILDWENSRIGDPAEDFAMLFSGIGDRVNRDDFYELYRRAGGPEISRERLDWYGVWGGVYVMIGALCVLARLDKYPLANKSGVIFGLLYAHHYASALPDLIARATREREKDETSRGQRQLT